ncbi:HesB-like protein [Clostridium thermarum]|uniref:HesB-like protein n=1 Tax=Clostridium thermarum TaxID=1716543 RepID=UPI0011242E82|nr:HesB-like protein [Clostridium thermarum]
MKLIDITEEAYKEFKNFLDENEIKEYNIRINFAGNSCSGPAFNISVDTPKEGDVVEKVKDITFMTEKDITDEFGGFVLLSTEENNGRGMSLRPLIEPEGGGCSSCPGCH